MQFAGELTPGLRFILRRRNRPPLGLPVIGAEVMTWAATSPSLLPRRWWATALNTAVLQGVGHGLGTAAEGLIYTVHPETFGRSTTRTGRRLWAGVHVLMLGGTVAAAATSVRRQIEMAQLVESKRFGTRESLLGVAAGTGGYAALLLTGEILRFFVHRSEGLFRRFLPRWVSWPLAVLTVGALSYVASDKLLVRRVLSEVSRRAQRLNLVVFPGVSQPWEPERSGSPWSLEPWHAVGAQGRAVLSGGPRARDIREVTADHRGDMDVHEPIRVYTGLVPGRSLADIADQAVREMRRTGAFHRDTICIYTVTGTGWIPDWSLGAMEFLTAGNCATVSMQYSYLPSAWAFAVDRETPVRAAHTLIERVLREVEGMPTRPRIVVAGESLGGLGTAGALRNLGPNAKLIDAVLLSGTPHFAPTVEALTGRREAGSPERLPLVDGGEHVRFIAHTDHLDTDYAGRPYAHPWRRPRVAILQHASDPIVWGGPRLLVRRPDWLEEAGARGVPAPPSHHADVTPRIRWLPLVTGWQVAVDMPESVHLPGGHGHRYQEVMIDTWHTLLSFDEPAPVPLDDELRRRIAEWISTHTVKR